MATGAVLWLRLKQWPMLPLFAVASSVMVRHTVVREASSTEKTCSIPHGIPRGLVRRGSPRNLLVASSAPAATPSLPAPRPWRHPPRRRRVLGGDDPRGDLVAASAAAGRAPSPPLVCGEPRRHAPRTPSPTAVHADSSAEAKTPAAIPWPPSRRRHLSLSPVGASSAATCPRPSSTATAQGRVADAACVPPPAGRSARPPRRRVFHGGGVPAAASR